jgi:hypothetical protein
MKSIVLRLLVTLGMMSGMAIIMPPAEVNAQAPTRRVCVQRNAAGRCIRSKVVRVKQPVRKPVR